MNFVKEMKVGNVMLSWGVNKVVGKGTARVTRERRQTWWLDDSVLHWDREHKEKGNFKRKWCRVQCGRSMRICPEGNKEDRNYLSLPHHTVNTHVLRDTHTSRGITPHRDVDVPNLRIKTATVWSENEALEASWGFRWKIYASLFIKNHHRGGANGALPPVQQRQSMVLWFYSAHVLSCFGW